MALDFQRPDPSSPAAVASAQFTVSRRGYREEEVRDFLRQVSVEIARLLERERFLENELRALQARGPIDVAAIDEAAVTELLGAEAARILSTAREAAQAMRDRAGDSAEQIVREASREANRLLEESTVEASRRRSDVSGEAEQELELAKQQGREIIGEVRAYRERVLADVAKRSEEARRELERLVYEREKLLSAFERARHAATDVVGDLNEFDEALRGTGVTPPLAPLDAPPPPRPTRRSESPIFDAKQYEHELGEAHRSADEGTPIDHEVEDVAVELPEPEVVVPEPPSADVESEIEPEPAPETEPLAEVVNISDRRRKKEPSRITHETAQEDAPEHPVFERVEGISDATEAEASNEDAPAGAQQENGTLLSSTALLSTAASHRVDEIFNRLRNASTARVADATTKDLAVTVKKPKAPATTAVEPQKVDESVFRRRSEVVNPALEALVRAVKRRLADDENAALTHVSSKRSQLTITAIFPATREHAQQYAEVIRELATSVAVDAARSISDARRADMRTAISQGGVIEAITEMLSNNLTQPLQERITSAMETAAGDRDTLLVALRTIFQEFKSQRITDTVSDIAYFTYARGLFLSCDTKAMVCWAVDPQGPPCADAEDNSLAGSLRRGDPFPTGHTHPLAHAGCRCLVVPLNK